MKLKRWMVMTAMALVLAACGSPVVGTPVARVDNVVLSSQELDQRMTRAEETSNALVVAGKIPSMPTPEELKQRLVEQFIDSNLTLGVARQHGIAITDEDIDRLIAQIRANIQQQSPNGLTLDEAIRAQLGLAGVDAPEFRQFVSYLVAQGKLSETLVTTDSVRLDLTNQMMAQASQKVDQVHVAYIVVATEDDAKKALDRLTQGAQFDALAKEVSMDQNTAPNGGDLGWMARSPQMPPELAKAIFDDLKPGEITQTPIKLQNNYYIIKVLEREQRAAMTEEQAKQAVEQGIPRELQQRRAQAFQQLIASERAKAKAENRLVEPDFAPPAPEQPAQGQPQPTPQP